MKKLLLLMAACFVMVACGSEEKKAEKQPETMVEFAEAMCAAAEAGDVKKYEELEKAAEEHSKELAKKENAEQLKKETEELEKWSKENAERVMKANAKLEEAMKAEENKEE